MNPILMSKDDMINTMISRDHQQKFIPADKRSEYGEYAWNKGQLTANRCLVNYPGQSPEQIARKMNLVVKESTGHGEYFSEYNRKSKIIVLFKNIIINSFIEPEQKYLVSTAYTKVKQIFLAHEIFHHLECTDPNIGITYKQRQVTVFSLGPFKWKSGLRCLSEIAAHSFALSMTGDSLIN